MFSLLGYIPSLNALKWASVAAGAALAVGFAWFSGHQAAERVLKPQLAAAEATISTLKGDLVKAQQSQAVITKYVDRIVKVKEAAQVITKEVPVYVTPASDRACVVPDGFVRIHDAAAKGEPPVSAGGANEAPSGVALSSVADTVTDNYATYHAVAAQLTALQEWVRVQTSDVRSKPKLRD